MAYAFNQLRTEYQQLFDTCQIDPTKIAEIDARVNKIVAGKSRYETVSAKTGVPWFFIGVVHNLECSCDFTKHLHNGDPLTARTVQEPKGYPKTGNPPFQWEFSAEDSLRLESLDQWTDWTIPGMLYKLEAYNGFGYRAKGINTPYLWSYSNQYSKGKFVADRVFDANAISKQVGAAVILHRMFERQLMTTAPSPDNNDVTEQIKQLGATVSFDPADYNADAEKLQRLLNTAGQQLDPDGKAGRNTSDAYHSITGQYLRNDPKA